MTWTVHTDVFDGPLDLLLHLVKRDGISLRDVSAARVADSYLAYLDRLKRLDLALASDYLVMAATLCHLKSLELLPRPPAVQEEEEDPKERLARQLEAYERVKEAAAALDGRLCVDRDVFVRMPMPIEAIERPVIPGIDAWGLLDVYFDLLVREQKMPPSPLHVQPIELRVDVCCQRVLRALGGPDGKGWLADILRALQTRAERVVTFVGVLEMARLGWLTFEQKRHLGPVRLVSTVSWDVDMGPLVGHVVAEA